MDYNTGNSSIYFEWENNSTEAPTVAVPCVPNYDLSVHVFVIPAVIIICIFSFLNKRINKRNCLGGRPGLVIPVDILTGYENRFTIAMGFGSATYSVALLFWGQVDESYKFLSLPGPWWVGAFTTIVSVLEIGILEYPTLACLSTSWRLTGSLTGFAYTLARMLTHVFVILGCTDRDVESTIRGFQFFVQLPVFVCRVFLLGRFLMLVCQHLVKKWCNVYDLKEQSEYEELSLASQSDIEHVKLLLVSFTKQRDEEIPKLIQKVKNAIYKRQSDFKYPIQILLAITVAAVLVYEITFGIVIIALLIWKERQEAIKWRELTIFLEGEDYYNSVVKSLYVLFFTILVAALVGVMNFIFHICHLLKCHREHMLRFFRSQRDFIPESLPSASGLVGLSFRYSGYQVSFLVWGFIISFGLLFAVTGGLAAAILFLPHIFNDELVKFIVDKLIALIPILAVTLFLLVLQKILSMFVFRNRSIPDNRITIDNRRLFLVFWFFFFFLNIIVGLFACLMRILKNMVLGVIFLGRLDRSGIIDGFESLDKGYMSYLGFLFVQAAHRNPVILVFLQILHDGARARGARKKQEIQVKVNFSVKEDVEKGQCLENLNEAAIALQERKSKAIQFRWQVAVTLVNNPILLHDRRKHVMLAKIKGRKVESTAQSTEIIPI